MADKLVDDQTMSISRDILSLSGLFDVRFYLDQLRDRDASEQDAISHYLRVGWMQGLDPSSTFSTNFYLQANPDVRDAGVNPLLHFITSGMAEGRNGLSPTQERRQFAALANDPPKAPSPDEWESLLSKPAPERSGPVIDIIVPVYRGYDETLRCLFSIISAAQIVQFNLVVVYDHGPEPELITVLRALAERSVFELYVTPENLGFVGACNLGMQLHLDRDVILLNSDTEVYNNWLDRLHAAAYSDEQVGTVTPLSNNAEICSYPRTLHDNWRALETGDADLDVLASRVNAGCVVEVPTGVGFCLYVKRSCLNHVGYFDFVSFGRGYGEENDLCRRIALSGWKNILALDVFVRHHGAVSFGGSKLAQVEAASEVMRKLHPDYFSAVDQYIRIDPAAEFRERLDLGRMARRACKNGAVLMVSHDWGGGTEKHISDLSESIENEGIASFILKVSQSDRSLFTISDPLTVEVVNIKGFDVTKDLDRFVDVLAKLNIRLVHVHHLAGLPSGTAQFLKRACEALDLRMDFTIHDYMPVCPRINMIDRSGFYCGEPEIAECERCIERDGSPFGKPAVREWRDSFYRILAGSTQRYVPDHDVARRLRRFFPDLSFVVRPHLEVITTRPSPVTRVPIVDQSGRRKIVIPGAIGENKGVKLLLECASRAADANLPIDFKIIGYTDRDAEFRKLPNVTSTGRYADGELDDLLDASQADLMFMSSVCPETYSYTLSSALRVGIFPVAFNLGAPASRLNALGWGAILPLELMLSADKVLSSLLSIEIKPFPKQLD